MRHTLDNGQVIDLAQVMTLTELLASVKAMPIATRIATIDSFRIGDNEVYRLGDDIGRA